MIVCHCHRVTDRDIKQCVRAGATNMRALGKACRAGTGCGGCRQAVQDVIKEAAGGVAKPSLPVL